MQATFSSLYTVSLAFAFLMLGCAGPKPELRPPQPVTSQAGVGGWVYFPREGIGRGVPVKEFSLARVPGKYLATINPATGRVTKVETVQSCGSAWLDLSARKQIFQWRARPYGYTKVYVPITFHSAS